jgi:hypothetical protein
MERLFVSTLLPEMWPAAETAHFPCPSSGNCRCSLFMVQPSRQTGIRFRDASADLPVPHRSDRFRTSPGFATFEHNWFVFIHSGRVPITQLAEHRHRWIVWLLRNIHHISLGYPGYPLDRKKTKPEARRNGRNIRFRGCRPGCYPGIASGVAAYLVRLAFRISYSWARCHPPSLCFINQTAFPKTCIGLYSHRGALYPEYNSTGLPVAMDFSVTTKVAMEPRW